MRKVLVAAALVLACGHHEDTAAGGKGTDSPDPGAGAPRLEVTSTAFAANAAIPSEHTCEGADVSPPLAWSGAPTTTKSFALIVDDPDAPDPAKPTRTWVHWVIASMPAAATALVAGKPGDGAIVGKNDWGKAAWGGPCPPTGRHRYFFKVYALDASVGKPDMTKAELLAAIKGHVVAAGTLIGTYEKHKK